jgi:DNA helicase-2/ATP-dependent DNA helicase PcrA
MSSLFDDSFLASLEPTGEEPPPPEDEGGAGPEPLADDLFGGRFDVPVPRDAYYRDGAARPPVDPAALLEGLNEQQRAAVVHAGSPLLIVAPAGCTRGRSWRSRSPTRPRAR